jgi:predicted acyl esterase
MGLVPTGAAFATAPMTANVTILGRGWLDAHLIIDRPGANLGIALYDVDPAGKWTEVDHGMRELRHAATRESSAPVAPGQAFNTSVWLYPEEITIAKGHKLGLAVSAELPQWIVPSPFVGTTLALALGDGKTALHLLARPTSS